MKRQFGKDVSFYIYTANDEDAVGGELNHTTLLILFSNNNKVINNQFVCGQLKDRQLVSAMTEPILFFT